MSSPESSNRDNESDKGNLDPTIDSFERKALLDPTSESYRQFAEESIYLAEFFVSLAKDDHILGIGLSNSKDGDIANITYIIKVAEDKDITRQAYQAAGAAHSQLNNALKHDSFDDVYAYFCNGRSFEETARLLAHPELRGEPKTEAERTLRSISAAMGEMEYQAFIKFE